MLNRISSDPNSGLNSDMTACWLTCFPPHRQHTYAFPEPPFIPGRMCFKTTICDLMEILRDGTLMSINNNKETGEKSASRSMCFSYDHWWYGVKNNLSQ